jgi:hypothetical protein
MKQKHITTTYKKKTHHQKTKKKFNCSPVIELEKSKLNLNTSSCLTPNVLQKLNVKNTSSVDEKTQDEFLKQKLNCQNDLCILSKLEKKNYADHIFTPFAPKKWKENSNEWLSNFDIRAVLKQYEVAYPDFKSFEPTPIDYDTIVYKEQCVSNELCNFSLKYYLEHNIQKIGVVFNLDTHDKPGSHWVSMYIEVFHNKRGIICFFDSTGVKIPRRLKKLKDEIIKQGRQLNIEFDFYDTSVEHQMQNTECGMYSLFFIITMISGKKGGNIKLKKTMTLVQKIHLFGLVQPHLKKTGIIRSRRNGYISDKNIEQFRKIYFNHHYDL